MKKSRVLFCTASGFVAISSQPCLADNPGKERPNIILIMVDDMGYSDIGCFGGEIQTPNIDKLAEKGVRYTQFYNTARSCPTRASLLTGLYPHQAGIGEMTEEPETKKDVENRPHGYKGYLNRNCVTLAEVLKEANYHTYMVGKWHVGMYDENRWPLQRGFDRYYGILAGATSYLMPQGVRGLTLDNTKLALPKQPYYTTDAFTNHALKFLKEQKDDNPFFLYVAYNAPHWPLQAKVKDIAKFVGKYDAGWEEIQKARYERMVKMGIIDESWEIAEWESRKWDDLTDKEKENSSLRMAVYAAQVYSMDYNVGKIIDYLEKENKLDNTLIIFFSDNGACAEPYSETGFGNMDMINNVDSWVAPSYGLPWAQVSNTPLRKYKVRAYEGGISTPFIISWQGKLASYNNQIRHNVAFLPDIMATFIDVAGATYPKEYHGGQKIIPLQGKSMLPTVANPKTELHEYIFGEHFDNRFVRWKNWKAVKDEKGQEWELYDITTDRTEHHNLAQQHPDILKKMVKKWDEWAHKSYVYPKR